MDGTGPRYNLHGLANLGGTGGQKGYTQVFRNGILESALGGILINLDDMNVLIERSLYQYFVDGIHRFLEGLRTLDVPTPIVLMVSFQEVGKARLLTSGREHFLHEVQPFPIEDPMLLPEVIFEEYLSKPDCLNKTRPILDALWNAAGFESCGFFDDDGTFKQTYGS